MNALTQDFPLGTNNLFARIEYSYFSDQFTDGDLDPFTSQDALGLLNARIGIDFTEMDANLTLWGRNITDERYYFGSFDAPAQDGRMNSYPGQPATWGVTFRKNFN